MGLRCELRALGDGGWGSSRSLSVSVLAAAGCWLLAAGCWLLAAGAGADAGGAVALVSDTTATASCQPHHADPVMTQVR
jgi:hypothetical protein